MKLKKWITFEPAFDKRNSNPNKDYGIHGMQIRFLLKGDKGVIQFLIYTNWHLQHVENELIRKCTGGIDGYCSLKPMAADIGYHSYIPQYEGQEPMSEECAYLENKPCYYDGSSLNAKRFLNILIKDGHYKFWREMIKEYKIQLLESK